MQQQKTAGLQLNALLQIPACETCNYIFKNAKKSGVAEVYCMLSKLAMITEGTDNTNKQDRQTGFNKSNNRHRLTAAAEILQLLQTSVVRHDIVWMRRS